MLKPPLNPLTPGWFPKDAKPTLTVIEISDFANFSSKFGIT